MFIDRHGVNTVESCDVKATQWNKGCLSKMWRVCPKGALNCQRRFGHDSCPFDSRWPHQDKKERDSKREVKVFFVSPGYIADIEQMARILF